jgi:hypothetical protein
MDYSKQLYSERLLAGNHFNHHGTIKRPSAELVCQWMATTSQEVIKDIKSAIYLMKLIKERMRIKSGMLAVNM